MDYTIFPPLHNFLSSPLLIAIVATLHVVVSHFAIGGGLLLYLEERKAIKEDDKDRFLWLKSISAKFLYITLTFGAVSGVGIWFTISLLSPFSTSYLISNFVWVWAMEWAFFILEVFAILLFVDTFDKVSNKLHLRINLVYFLSAYLSLFLINGIITFQLTPSKDKIKVDLFKAFFNKTFFPSLFARTFIAVMIGAMFFIFFLSFRKDDDFKKITSKRYFKFAFYSFVFLILSLAFYFYQIPKESKTSSLQISYFSGLFYLCLLLLLFSILFSFFLTVLFPPLNKPRFSILPLIFLAMSFGMMEWIREDLRLPYIVTGVSYGNDLSVKNFPSYQDNGILKQAPFLSNIKDNDIKGELLYKKFCGNCHTLKSVNNLEKIFSRIDEDYSVSLIKKSTFMRAPMPPFAGGDEEAKLIYSYIRKKIKMKPPYKEGSKIFSVRCSPCHTIGLKYRDLKLSFKGVDEGTIYEMIGSLDSLTESMPKWSGSEEERKILAKYLFEIANEGGKK